MLHIREYFKTRQDGIRLYRTYSDEYMIQKVGTEETYLEAIDIENSENTYTETDIPLEPEEQAALDDAMKMLNELGVQIND